MGILELRADGRAEGLSAIGDRRQATVPLTPVIDGTHIYSKVIQLSIYKNLFFFKFSSISSVITEY